MKGPGLRSWARDAGLPGRCGDEAIAPLGTEMIRDYLNMGEDFWSWERIFEPIHAFMDDPATHELKSLEPRVNFFEKHPSQVKYD